MMPARQTRWRARAVCRTLADLYPQLYRGVSPGQQRSIISDNEKKIKNKTKQKNVITC